MIKVNGVKDLTPQPNPKKMGWVYLDGPELKVVATSPSLHHLLGEHLTIKEQSNETH